MKRRILLLFLVITIVLLYIFPVTASSPIKAVLQAFDSYVDGSPVAQFVTAKSDDIEPENLTVSFLDVGQSDSIFIDYGKYEILIDGGDNQHGPEVVNYLRKYVDGDLDLMIATHPDADHIGGLDDVLAAYQVDKIIDSGDTSKKTKTYADFFAAASSEPNCQIIDDSDLTIPIGDHATLKIIETGDNYSDTNDNSVVSLLTYKKVKVLFTGDMQSAAESASLSKFCDVDVLKAGHHGSNTSSSKAFLNVVKPEYVIISAGRNNPYGHPHKPTMQRFFDVGATVYGTFKSGTIVMTTNGRSYSFNTTSKLSINDAGAVANTP